MLAILGGKPVCKKEWPIWPPVTEGSKAQLNDVLDSHRWTVRGWYTGRPSKQVEFAGKFAKFNNSKYCVTVSSGSTSLLVSLEALDIGYGDEVIVPVYTWVATAIAVTNVNAIPVFVDADHTGCMDPYKVEAAITPRTRAIIPVHLHCAITNMEAIMTIAKQHELYVIEDCAQAHGARLKDRCVGTFGHIGAYSTNQEKVLSCGEGGMIVTDDQNIYVRLEQLRNDGGRPISTAPVIGKYEFVETGGLMGSNYCMSDFQAAILMEELEHLEERNRCRERNALYLDEKLAELGGLVPIGSSAGTTARTYFKYAIQRKPDDFEGVPTSRLCDALSAELGFSVEQTECKPLHQNKLYCPNTKRRHHLNDQYLQRLDVSNLQFPLAEYHYENTLVFNHRILLGTQEDMNDIVEAFAKVQKYARSLL